MERLLRGLSQSEVGKQTKIHHSILSLLECSYMKPSERHKAALSQFFGVPVDQIFPNEEE
jgi:transcriptional regulator with XRE-family HTH domain